MCYILPPLKQNNSMLIFQVIDSSNTSKGACFIQQEDKNQSLYNFDSYQDYILK